jgi:hypothetical protein
MTAQEARQVFDSAIAKSAHDTDTVAKLELCREYFTNPAFRSALEDEIYKFTR